MPHSCVVIETREGMGPRDIDHALTAIIKSRMKLAGMRYEDLSRALKLLGYSQSPSSISSKLSRGGYAAAFLVACLSATGATSIELRPGIPGPRRGQGPEGDPVAGSGS